MCVSFFLATFVANIFRFDKYLANYTREVGAEMAQSV
jgi:hypothetical protein